MLALVTPNRSRKPSDPDHCSKRTNLPPSLSGSAGRTGESQIDPLSPPSNGGACDGTDSCDGAGHCVDGFKSATTTCRPSAGQCDVAESCTGTSGACPADGFASSSTSCTGTSNGGAGDGADHCSGTSNSCVDVFLSSTTTCR